MTWPGRKNGTVTAADRDSKAPARDLIADVLVFWFGDKAADGPLRPRRVWFQADRAFDHACSEQFADAVTAACAGRLDDWAATPEGALALVLLLDQFSRNIHRGRAAAFAGDEHARKVSGAAVARGFDLTLEPVERLFFYLPFEHSEALADQERSCQLIGTLGDAEWLRYAERHREIIARFGRFPHRNAILGRASTAEETAFLKEPDSSF